MLPVSQAWRASVATSHQVVSRVEVWSGGRCVVPDLPVRGGTVTRDWGATITGSAEVELADPAHLPAEPGDPLAPYGGELRIHLGIRHPTGAVETVQVFAGPLVRCPTWPATAGRFTITAESWLRYVADARFLAPWSAPAGSSIRDALTVLLAEAAPDVPVRFAGPEVGTGPAPGTVWEEDRMQAVADLAAAAGCVVRDTGDGAFLVAPDPQPDPAADPVRRFAPGPDSTLLDRTSPEMARSDRYNAVVAYSTEDDSVRAVAVLDDPAHPARWDGPFGRRPMFFASPLLTAATVEAAATTRLRNQDGRSRIITVETAPDPSLEPGDHVHLAWPSPPRQRTQVQETAMVVKAVHPIGLGETRLELRGTG